MHSTEFKQLAEDADDVSEIILALAPKNGSTNTMLVLSYDPDLDRYAVCEVHAMRHRDMTFREWSWERREFFSIMANALTNFKKAI